MPTWTEATLRAASPWQAFKQARHFLDSGAANLTKLTDSAALGTVREGKHLHRGSLTALGPNIFEARCSCPENRSTGKLCAHTIALGLLALQPRTEAAVPAPAAPLPPAPGPAWKVVLPPNWVESLRRGRLAASLSHAPPTSARDEALNLWLSAAGADPRKSPQHLQLADAQLDGFLATLSGHPRLVCGRESNPLEVSSGAQIQLENCQRVGDSVVLSPSSGDKGTTIGLGPVGRWLLTDGAPAVLARVQIPESQPLKGLVQALAEGNPANLPVDTFLRHLDPLQTALRFPPDCWAESLHFVAASCDFDLRLDGTLDHLKAALSVRYGDHPAVAPGQSGETGLPRLTGPDRCETRNHAAEAEAIAVLARAGFIPDASAPHLWAIRSEDLATRFLTHTLPSLETDWTVRLAPNLARSRAALRIVEPKIEIVGSGEDWLSFNLSYQTTDGETIPAADIRRLLGSGGGKGISRSLVSSNRFDVLDPLLAELDVRQENGVYTAKSFAIPVIHEICNNIGKALIPNDQREFASHPISQVVRASLRPYQRLGLGWLSDRLNRFKGALLADDMGLGKTLQAISLIEELCPAGSPPALVVMPTSLLGNWSAEFSRFSPERKVIVLHGSQRDSKRDQIGLDTVVLTTFATLARDLAWHLRQDYRLVVADEASQIRNPETDHAKALCKIRAEHRLALTGTPLENSVRDLWSIFHFILPGWLGQRSDFRDRYEAPLATQPPDPAALARLRLKTAPFILRRTKTQVAPELPTKLIIDEYCDLSPQQQSAYQQLLREGRQRVETTVGSGNTGAARMQLLTALLRLRQASCDLALLGNERFQKLPVSQRSGKMERLLELLESALANGSKVLIFSQFRTQLQEIEKQLAPSDWPSLRLDGQSRNRQELVDRFQSPDGPPVFLISLKAGGYGLNLTAADVVIHFDPWWNPAAETQATDRAHRIGQTRPVTVYRLLSRHTVEEKVVRLQARKRDLAGIIDETGEADTSPLTVEELQVLLSP